jgi:hypothetical protein
MNFEKNQARVLKFLQRRRHAEASVSLERSHHVFGFRLLRALRSAREGKPQIDVLAAAAQKICEPFFS